MLVYFQLYFLTHKKTDYDERKNNSQFYCVLLSCNGIFCGGGGFRKDKTEPNIENMMI